MKLITYGLAALVTCVAGDFGFAQGPRDSNQPKVLQVRPAAEVVPALQYRFWPERSEQVSGNRMVRYQRAIVLMQQADMSDKSEEDSIWVKYESVDDMPVDEVRNYLRKYKVALAELHAATPMRESKYDLAIEEISGPEVVQFLLPEFQEMRSLARLLQLEFKVALDEGRMEDAMRTLQAGFRLGESCGHAADFLVSRLVGIAITGMMLGSVEELMQTDDCPNLYWALATIPESSWEVIEAARFDASGVSRMFPSLKDLPEGSSAGVWNERVYEALNNLAQMGGVEEPSVEDQVRNRLLAGLAAVMLAESSREQLLADGEDVEIVRSMSGSEAIVRVTANSMREILDQILKETYLPPRVRRMRKVSIGESLEAFRVKRQMVGEFAYVISSMLLPSIEATDRASARTEQAVYRLMTIEALRDHVATHGAVPESLEDLKTLSALESPINYEPFKYRKLDDLRCELETAPAYPRDNQTKTVLEFQMGSQ